MHASVNVHTRMRTHTHRYIQFFKHVFLSWLCHVTKILRSLPLFFSYSFCPPSLNGLSLSFPSLFQLITWLSQFSYQFSFHLFLNSVHSQKHVMCDRLFTMNPSHCIMCTSAFYKCSEHKKEIWPPQWRLRLCVQLLRKSYMQDISQWLFPILGICCKNHLILNEYCPVHCSVCVSMVILAFLWVFFILENYCFSSSSLAIFSAVWIQS